MKLSRTVNSEEIKRYNQLAHTWWDPTGPMWPLHRLNDARTPFVEHTIRTKLRPGANIDRPLAGLKLLDIGCGAGLLSESMAKLGASVTAVDPAERNIDIARSHARLSGLDIDYRCAAIEDIDAEPFDVVLNMEVVEHVEALPDFMAKCCSLTARGGLHFVATINRNLLSWLVAIVGAEYILGWLPKGTHQWRKFVTPEETAAMLAGGDMSIVERCGVFVNPVTREVKIGSFTGVNYMVAAMRHSG
ncbi:hypothetical protein A3709_02495 [Halioglobus sp. HI00S01]|nr:hypothetical protein A3709_02495 [Halioglobus sp. HI00S01]